LIFELLPDLLWPPPQVGSGGDFFSQHISMMVEGGGARISLAAGARGRVRRLVWQQPIQQPIFAS